MSEGKKSRKHGRNKAVCAAYKTSHTAEFNKARRLIRYLRKWPKQADARAALVKLDKGSLFTAQRKNLGLTDGPARALLDMAV